MSGIGGIVNFNNQPVLQEEIEALITAITHRGKDRTGSYRSNCLGFVHCMLHTTEGSLSEYLPNRDPLSGNVITADARLDNRRELTAELGLSAMLETDLPDSSLILAAYNKWGEKCSAKLIGDFAFAIWDEKRQKLFCARDHMGVKPFYYFATDTTFIFGSEIKALIQTGKTSKSINKQRILDYLVFYHGDNEATFYNDIKRLPARYSLSVSKDHLQKTEYWTFSPQREIHLHSDQEYAEAFLEHFSRAVDSRLRSLSRVGSLLSGGLDSSSICCMAADLLKLQQKSRIITFSEVFEELPSAVRHKADEREHMDAAIERCGSEAYFVNIHKHGPLRGIECGHFDEPMPYFNGYLLDESCASAEKRGVRVLLDGTDGDTTVSHGYERLFELGTRYRLFALFTEIRRLHQRQGKNFSLARTLKRYCIRPSIPDVVVTHIRRILKRDTTSRYPVISKLHPHLQRYVDWERRAEQLGQNINLYRKGRLPHYWSLTSPFQQYTMEFIDSRIAGVPIEMRYPFWDRRLMEFCLALPLDQKLKNGLTRVVLRRAMKGILPEKIRLRPDKADLSPQFLMDLARTGDSYIGLLMESNSKIREYIDISNLSQQWQEYKKTPYTQPDTARELYLFISLELWLRMH